MMYFSDPWAVIKYGGTSVSSVACWHNIVEVHSAKTCNTELRVSC